MADLDLGCSLSTPLGTYLNLTTTPSYKLEATSMGERQVTHRKMTAKNPYIEGEYTTLSVREQVAETLAVWCHGQGSPTTLRTRVEALVACFEQLTYTVVFRVGTQTETWYCQPADYTVKSDAPLRVATMALVTAQVPRSPTVTLS